MTNFTLYQRLNPVIKRIRFRRVMLTLTAVLFCFAFVVLAMILLNQSGQLDVRGFWLPLSLVAAMTCVVGWVWACRSVGSTAEVIQKLEQRFPDLDSALMTAAEQSSDRGKPLGFLQQDVLRRVVNHSFANEWKSLIPGWHLFAVPVIGLLAFVSLAAATLFMEVNAVSIPAVEAPLKFSTVATDNSNYEISVEPGNVEVERGKSLLVLARFSEAIPPESFLVYSFFADESTSDPQSEDEPKLEEVRVPMNKSLDDPIFGARIASISKPCNYWVEFAGQQSEQFEVSIFEYPALVRADAELDFPEYTKMENKTVQDVRRVSAVEGTQVELSFFLNKEGTTATLVPKAESDSAGENSIKLVPDSSDPKRMTAQIEMIESSKFELLLVDQDGRENRVPPTLAMNVLKNQLPDLKLTSPRRDVQVSAIEELELAATAWDDFGINSLGVNFSISGKSDNDLVLLEDAAPKKKHLVDHLLEFEELQAAPDELLSYYFWAEDVGPDGEPRRVESDMFFAEVRHFDEIFRQGAAPPAGQPPSGQPGESGENAEKAQELAELQKEIINATWRVVRREKSASVSEVFGEDTALLVESQGEALTKLQEAAAEIEDVNSQAFVEAGLAYMQEAIVHFNEANTANDAGPLKSALTSTQAAYQSLLKLRAREHEVVRSQQQQPGQPGQQAGNRSQQQMEQLNLKEDENRYENEKTAQDSQAATAQQEDRQVLSRLRELARRQEDLNDRIKELQSELDKAESKEEQEEIERRLKSLREQQEQLLRDADDLLDRMQEPENQQRMSEESEQLEQTRENIREASESLEKGDVSQAAAEGTRAQRDLEELRDEFQERTAGQFNEQMRQMRNEAQELEQQQDEIRDELTEADQGRDSSNDSQAPSLPSDEGGTEDLTQRLAEQSEAVQVLRERMKETIEEAETFEPLLAEDLYDTYRKSEVTRPDRALDSARESFERGFTDDARSEQQRAADGVTEMREGIERAAESVLGDETDALQAAEKTLQDLNRELEEELQRARGGGDENVSEGESNEGERGSDGRPNAENESSESELSESGKPSQQQGDQAGSGESEPGAEPSKDRRQPGAGQPGETQGDGNQPTPGQPGQNDQPGKDQQPNEGQQPGQGGGGESEQPDGNRNGEQEPQPGERQPADARQGILDRMGGDDRGGQFNQTGGGGNVDMRQPISGEDFRDWSDRLRDVEEMMSDPDLRSEAAQIRERAREIRREMKKRHSPEPNWDLVKMNVLKPLAELQDRVSEEVLRRTAKDARVPLDRDPVPAEYQDAVRRYYERIGSGQ